MSDGPVTVPQGRNVKLALALGRWSRAETCELEQETERVVEAALELAGLPLADEIFEAYTTDGFKTLCRLMADTWADFAMVELPA